MESQHEDGGSSNKVHPSRPYNEGIDICKLWLGEICSKFAVCIAMWNFLCQLVYLCLAMKQTIAFWLVNLYVIGSYMNKLLHEQCESYRAATVVVAATSSNT